MKRKEKEDERERERILNENLVRFHRVDANLTPEL